MKRFRNYLMLAAGIGVLRCPSRQVPGNPCGASLSSTYRHIVKYSGSP